MRIFLPVLSTLCDVCWIPATTLSGYVNVACLTRIVDKDGAESLVVNLIMDTDMAIVGRGSSACSFGRLGREGCSPTPR